MKWLVFLGFLIFYGLAEAQTDPDRAQFINVTKYDLVVAETAGEAYGCDLRSDAWTDFTLRWVHSDIDAKADAIWPEKIIVGKPIDMTNAAEAIARYNDAIATYRIGLVDTRAECEALENS